MEALMFEGIVPVLSLVTLLVVAAFAIISRERTKDRMRDPNAPVSTLAKDGKYGGVPFLLPLDERTALARRADERYPELMPFERRFGEEAAVSRPVVTPEWRAAEARRADERRSRLIKV
jgi:hypothetical protein